MSRLAGPGREPDKGCDLSTESVLSVQAEAADEAIAFLHAAVGQLPLNHRIYWESRILAAQSDDVARQLIGLGPKLIVVLNGGDLSAARLTVNSVGQALAARLFVLVSRRHLSSMWPVKRKLSTNE